MHSLLQSTKKTIASLPAMLLQGLSSLPSLGRQQLLLSCWSSPITPPSMLCADVAVCSLWRICTVPEMNVCSRLAVLRFQNCVGRILCHARQCKRTCSGASRVFGLSTRQTFVVSVGVRLRSPLKQGLCLVLLWLCCCIVLLSFDEFAAQFRSPLLLLRFSKLYRKDPLLCTTLHACLARRKQNSRLVSETDPLGVC